MVKCSYCNTEIPVGSRTIYVYKSGKIIDFCSKKCEKNLIKLGRKAREQKWVTSQKK